jgi:hypothetical protein
MVRPEDGQVSGNKGILDACNLDEFGEGKGSNSLLFSSSVRQALALRTRVRWHRRPIGRRDAAQGSAIGLSLMVYSIECSLRHRIVLLLQENLHWKLSASHFQFETSVGPKDLCIMSITLNQALDERCLQISPPRDMAIDLVGCYNHAARVPQFTPVAVGCFCSTEPRGMSRLIASVVAQ